MFFEAWAEAEEAAAQEAWDGGKHPRGPGGRFVSLAAAASMAEKSHGHGRAHGAHSVADEVGKAVDDLQIPEPGASALKKRARTAAAAHGTPGDNPWPGLVDEGERQAPLRAKGRDNAWPGLTADAEQHARPKGRDNAWPGLVADAERQPPKRSTPKPPPETDAQRRARFPAATGPAAPRENAWPGLVDEGGRQAAQRRTPRDNAWPSIVADAEHQAAGRPKRRESPWRDSETDAERRARIPAATSPGAPRDNAWPELTSQMPKPKKVRKRQR